MERGWRSGPRLPTVHRPTDADELIADPAKGESVPRCGACGIPGGMEFALLLHGKPAGRYRLCGKCWTYANPPDRQATDPLQA